MPSWNKNYYPMEKIYKWVEDGKPQSWIARRLKVDIRLIHKLCKKHKLVCRNIQGQPGSNNPNWRGGRVIDKSGYVLVYFVGHPYARKHFPNHILEHRLVMEKKIGRYLLPREVVHHKNGIKSDNRLSNLELYSDNGEHLKHDLKGRCPNWSKEGKLRILRAVRLRVRNQKKLKSYAT